MRETLSDITKNMINTKRRQQRNPISFRVQYYLTLVTISWQYYIT